LGQNPSSIKVRHSGQFGVKNQATTAMIAFIIASV
jgi:hypothetical protein